MEPQSPSNMMLGHHHQHQGSMVNSEHFNILTSEAGGHHGYYPGHAHPAHAHAQIHNNRMDWPPSAESQFYPSELRYR